MATNVMPLSPTVRSRLRGAIVAVALWAPTTLLFASGKPDETAIDLVVASFPVSAGIGALRAPAAARSRGMAHRAAAQFAVLSVIVGSLTWALPYALFHPEDHSFVGALRGYAAIGLLFMGLPLLMLGFNLALLWAAIVRQIAGRVAPSLLLMILVVIVVTGCTPVTTIWIENRSAEPHPLFVDNLSDHPALWYIVPPNTIASAGSSTGEAVRVNVLGWRHEQGHVAPCSPGDYDDTLYDVPLAASVRLLIEEDGRPSVGFASEPPGLPRLPEASIGPLTEDELCAWFAQHASSATPQP